MGYIGNMLPRHLARLGADVHYLTMDLPHYFQASDRIHSYGTFAGLDVVQPGPWRRTTASRCTVWGTNRRLAK